MTKNICVLCGKSASNKGICVADESMNPEGKMSYCPSYIKKRVDKSKPLVSSPFKVLSHFQIAKTINI